MSAPIQRIMNNLQRFKQIEQKPDTLAARVLEAEHQLYPQCIALACEGKARVAGERVRLQVREFGADLLMNPHD